MKFIVTLFLLFSLHSILSSQDRVHQEIIEPINNLFDGMRAGDSSIVSKVFTADATLSSVIRNSEGEVIKRSRPSSTFIEAVGTPHEEIWDERIWSYDVKLDGPLAYVWTEYTFYRGETLSHCGVNMFELIKSQDGWKISTVTDTRRWENCREQ